VNLWKLPDVLILGLKRYKQQESETWFGPAQMRRKIENLVDFPAEALNLSESMDPRSPEKDCLYDLFAVCNHYGRMGFGHYTAAARDWDETGLSQQWYSYDDDRVERCGISEVKTSAAYILFYRKRACSGGVKYSTADTDAFTGISDSKPGFASLCGGAGSTINSVHTK